MRGLNRTGGVGTVSTLGSVMIGGLKSKKMFARLMSCVPGVNGERGLIRKLTKP